MREREGVQAALDGDTWQSVEEDIESINDYYDSAASIMSFGLMDRWRSQAAAETEEWMNVLEIGSGPGSLSVMLKGKEIVLLEPNDVMLRRSKRERLADPRYMPVIGVAEHMPFREGVFDRTVSGFSFKNLIDRDRALSEMRRVLRNGGKNVIIDIAEPDTDFRKRFMHFYMKHILFRLAFFVVPRKERKRWGKNPWKHLSLSYLNLGNPEALSEKMRSTGFSETEYRYLATHGVALITGRK